MHLERNDYTFNLADGKEDVVHTFHLYVGKKILAVYLWPRSWDWSWGLGELNDSFHVGPISFSLRTVKCAKSTS